MRTCEGIFVFPKGTGGENSRGVFQLEGISAHPPLPMFFFTSRSQGTEIADNSKKQAIYLKSYVERSSRTSSMGYYYRSPNRTRIFHLDREMCVGSKNTRVKSSPQQGLRGIKHPSWKPELAHGAGGEQSRLIPPCVHLFLFLLVNYLSLEPSRHSLLIS